MKNKVWKRIITAGLAATLVFSLTACGGICKFEADSSAWEAAESAEDWLERVGRKLEEELDRQEGEDGI